MSMLAFGTGLRVACAWKRSLKSAGATSKPLAEEPLCFSLLFLLQPFFMESHTPARLPEPHLTRNMVTRCVLV